MSSVLRKNTSVEAWDQWIDGLHQALARVKENLGSSRTHFGRALESFMRDFHQIKASAQALGLHGVQAVAHDLESRVQEYRGRAGSEAGELAFKSLLEEGVRKLDAVLARLHELALQTAAQREVSGGLPDHRLSGLLERIGSATRGIAVELGQSIEIDVKGGSDLELDEEMETWLEAALLHAVRNSLDHGIDGGCKGDLKIRIEARREAGAFVIECQDSGLGIDPERVRMAMRERHARFDAEMGSMKDEEILQLLFLPGLSLSRGASRLSGRGYGLNIVREAVETRLRGKAHLSSKLGQGTRLILRIPTAQVQSKRRT